MGGTVVSSVRTWISGLGSIGLCAGQCRVHGHMETGSMSWEGQTGRVRKGSSGADQTFNIPDLVVIEVQGRSDFAVLGPPNRANRPVLAVTGWSVVCHVWIGPRAWWKVVIGSE